MIPPFPLSPLWFPSPDAYRADLPSPEAIAERLKLWDEKEEE